MIFVIEVNDKNVKEKLCKYGTIKYECKYINILYLEVLDEKIKEDILKISGVISLSQEGTGILI